MFFKYFENDNLLKCHRILAALVFFLPSMCFICYISWILQKSLVTFVAWICSLPSRSSHIHLNERFPPSVCFKMSYKINIQQYCLVTLVTLVWFCHYASSHGLLNYLSLWNSCHIALIWFLPRMYFEMSCKITMPWRGLVTLTEVICIFYLECILLLSKCIFKLFVQLLFSEKKLATLT